MYGQEFPLQELDDQQTSTCDRRLRLCQCQEFYLYPSQNQLPSKNIVVRKPKRKISLFLVSVVGEIQWRHNGKLENKRVPIISIY